MQYTIDFFGEDCEQIWNNKRHTQDLIRTIEELDMEIGYKCAPDLNSHFRETLDEVSLGDWETEVASDFYLNTQLKSTGKKEVDLRNFGDRVDVEIELGNVASAYRDIVKFNLHYNSDKIDLGVIVLCSSEATKIMGENIARSERTIDELDIIFSNNPRGHCPIVVLGLTPYDNNGDSIISPEAEEQLRELRERRNNN